MKIAVFSDTHGLAQGMIDAVREYRPDQVIHLGDGMRDAERLMREFPEIPVCTVPAIAIMTAMTPSTRSLIYAA